MTKGTSFADAAGLSLDWQPAPDENPNRVSSLWIGGPLSNIELLSIRSFLRHGHEYWLYSYDPSLAVPAGCRLVDANRILPESAIFRYADKAGPGRGSVAPFANLLRYRMMYQTGGWWADTDVICLRPLRFSAALQFGYENHEIIGCSVLRSAKGCPVMRKLYEIALAMGQDLSWGETGPRLVTGVLMHLGLAKNAHPPEVFYPVPFPDWQAPIVTQLRDAVLRATQNAYTLHLWNEAYRRAAINKFAPFQPGTFLDLVDRQCRGEAG